MGTQTSGRFPGRVKRLREAAGLTQQQLANQANVSISSLAQIEQGKTPDPRLSTVFALARALGVKPCKLIDGLADE